MMTHSAAHEGIVIRGHGKSFIVRCHNKNISCEIRGKLKHKTHSTTPVAVGDDVIISFNPDGTGMIEDIEERRSMFFRAAKGIEAKKQIIAANLDQLAIISSVKSPPLKTGLIDRFLVASKAGGLQPLIIINKIDLGKTEFLLIVERAYQSLGFPVCLVSAQTGEGCEKLQELLKDHKSIFAGHSGVGKSALLNRLIPGLDLKTGEVSSYSNRGIHTTSLVELFALSHGGFVIDSPGLKVLGLWQVERNEVAEHYPEFEKYISQCRFTGCIHVSEPDCAVKEAVANGTIPQFRYENYVAIFNSISLTPDYSLREKK